MLHKVMLNYVIILVFNPVMSDFKLKMICIVIPSVRFINVLMINNCKRVFEICFFFPIITNKNFNI